MKSGARRTTGVLSDGPAGPTGPAALTRKSPAPIKGPTRGKDRAPGLGGLMGARIGGYVYSQMTPSIRKSAVCSSVTNKNRQSGKVPGTSA